MTLKLAVYASLFGIHETLLSVLGNVFIIDQWMKSLPDTASRAKIGEIERNLHALTSACIKKKKKSIT